MSASALYLGTVRHRRLEGAGRQFTHRIALAYLDLDELPTLLGGRLTRKRPGVVRVRRCDLLGGNTDDRDVRITVRELIEQRTGRPAADGPLRVLTHPRTFGTCFNPVSLYYAFDPHERLDAVVAEVTNTPWGQRHSYVLRGEEGERPAVLRGAHVKALHVSPFQPMDRSHRWAATTPGPTLSLHVANHRESDERADFDATLELHRHELTARSLRRTTARYPAGTLRVLVLIYGHALGLKLRGAPHFRNRMSAGAR